MRVDEGRGRRKNEWRGEESRRRMGICIKHSANALSSFPPDNSAARAIQSPSNSMKLRIAVSP